MGRGGESRPLILAALFASACAVLLVGVYCLRGRVEALWDEDGALEGRRAELEAEMGLLVARKRLLSDALGALERYDFDLPSRVTFYSLVQRAAQDNAVEILFTRWRDGPGHEGREAAGAMTVTLRGDYYDVARMLAAWRTLPALSRVSALSLRGVRPSESAPSPGLVEAEVTLEALLASQ